MSQRPRRSTAGNPTARQNYLTNLNNNNNRSSRSSSSSTTWHASGNTFRTRDEAEASKTLNSMQERKFAEILVKMKDNGNDNQIVPTKAYVMKGWWTRNSEIARQLLAPYDNANHSSYLINFFQQDIKHVGENKMSTSADNDIVSLNFRYRNAGNKNILFAIEISKDKTVSDLEEEKKGLRDVSWKWDRELAKVVQALKEKPKRAFSTYKSLSEVLAKYGIDSNVRLKNHGNLVVDSLEAMRNEYVVAILHSAIDITRDDTGKELSMRPEYEVIGEESSGRVDYAIKDVENLICITEDKPQRNVIEGFAQNIKQLEMTTARDWHFLLYTPGRISQGSKDRACAEEEPDKRARVEGYRTKKQSYILV
ncbi:hypothetical protein C1646_750788 [Rhizophagus diaphanus]|nr:hypothetical protein C1646_750788 [Rhizophagus diaphanus] [Rhizophagus sp. MUCL 43196]